MRNDLIKRLIGIAESISVYNADDPVILKPTFYNVDGSESVFGDFNINMDSNIINQITEDTVKVEYKIEINLNFSEVINGKRVDNYQFNLIVKEWMNDWDMGGESSYKRWMDRYVVKASTKLRTVDFLSAIKRMNESGFSTTIKDFRKKTLKIVNDFDDAKLKYNKHTQDFTQYKSKQLDKFYEIPEIEPDYKDKLLKMIVHMINILHEFKFNGGDVPISIEIPEVTESGEYDRIIAFYISDTSELGWVVEFENQTEYNIEELNSSVFVSIYYELIKHPLVQDKLNYGAMKKMNESIKNNTFNNDLNVFKDEVLKYDERYHILFKKYINYTSGEKWDKLYTDQENKFKLSELNRKELLKRIIILLNILKSSDKYVNDAYIYREIVVPKISFGPYKEDDNYGKLIHALLPPHYQNDDEGIWRVQGSAYDETPVRDLHDFDLVYLYEDLMGVKDIHTNVSGKALKKINENKFYNNIDVVRKKNLELNSEYNRGRSKFMKTKYEFEEFKKTKLEEIQNTKLDKKDKEKLISIIDFLLEKLLVNQEDNNNVNLYLKKGIEICFLHTFDVNKYVNIYHIYKKNGHLNWWLSIDHSDIDDYPIRHLRGSALINLYDGLMEIPEMSALINAKAFKKINESTEEVWKEFPVDGYGSYKISNLGRVKNKREVFIRPHIKKRSKNIHIIGLTINNKKKNFILSQMVAKAFITGSGSVVHLDGDKGNNKVDNLKYTNNPSKYASKFSDNPTGYEAHDSFTIHQCDLEGNIIKTFGSIGDAGRELGIPTTNISRVAKGQRNTAGGYTWEYDTNKREHKGTNPDEIKDIRDYYSMNDVNFSDVWRKFKTTADAYGMGRIIKSSVYKTEVYLSDRSKDLIEKLGNISDDQIIDTMFKKHRYYITDRMLSELRN